jgi:hypothetical protein
MSSIIFAATSVALITASAATADEAWVCTYLVNSSAKPTIEKFYVEGGNLIEVGHSLQAKDVTIKYTILANNENVIVAAFGTSTESISIVHGVGAYVVAIDKKTLESVQSFTNVSDPLNHSWDGICVKN